MVHNLYSFVKTIWVFVSVFLFTPPLSRYQHADCYLQKTDLTLDPNERK